MGKGLVSVIIPTYNRGYCIEATLRSVIAQTHRDWEAIVMDDGSSDDTRQIVQHLAEIDQRIHYHWQSNAGVAAARNAGLRLAQGDFVALLDSDDLWRPWKLEAQLACLDAVPDAGMIWTDMEAVDDSGRQIAKRYLRTMYDAYRQAPTEAIFPASAEVATVAGLPADVLAAAEGGKLWSGNIYAAMFLGNLVHTSTVLLRRSRLEQIGGFDEALKISGEDYDFHLRTCRHGPVAFLDAPSISYRVGATDQLTDAANHLHMARNFLTTVLSALSHGGSEELLSARQRASVLAKAYGWMGEELFQAGIFHEARTSLGISIKYYPWRRRVLKLWLASLLPGSMLRQLLSFYRKGHQAS